MAHFDHLKSDKIDCKYTQSGKKTAKITHWEYISRTYRQTYRQSDINLKNSITMPSLLEDDELIKLDEVTIANTSGLRLLLLHFLLLLWVEFLLFWSLLFSEQWHWHNSLVLWGWTMQSDLAKIAKSKGVEISISNVLFRHHQTKQY